MGRLQLGGKHGVDSGVFKDPLLDHGLGAAGDRILAGLEDEFDGACEIGGRLDQQPAA